MNKTSIRTFRISGVEVTFAIPPREDDSGIEIRSVKTPYGDDITQFALDFAEDALIELALHTPTYPGED